MKSIHPSDTDIQRYSLAESDCGPDVREHISRCELCTQRAKNYQLLFSAIVDSPKPVLDFDVAGMILAALPEHKKARAVRDRWLYLIAFSAICFLGTLAWLLQQDLYGSFDGLTRMAMYVLMAPIIGILLWQSYHLFKKHRNQMRHLTGTI